MKRIILFFVIIHFFSLSLTASGLKENSIKVMSFNIRFSSDWDKENNWKYRKDIAAHAIESRRPDILCMQEALSEQIEYIVTQFPEYEWYSVSSFWSEKGLNNIFMPIYFNKKKYDIIDKGHFWLSETPEEPSSKSWHVKYSRFVVWIKLRIRKSGDCFFVFNTHFDHVSRKSRFESARVLVEKIHEISSFEKVILTGDFNSKPRKMPWRVLTGKREVYNVRSPLQDAYLLSRIDKKEVGTFHMYTGRMYHLFGRFDWILVSPDIEVHDFNVVRYNENGKYPSDHFPVIAYIEI